MRFFWFVRKVVKPPCQKYIGGVKPVPKVRCPTCKKRGDWFAGAYGPFCSKRCKLVDLGKWLHEEHKVSEPLRPDQFTTPEESD